MKDELRWRRNRTSVCGSPPLFFSSLPDFKVYKVRMEGKYFLQQQKEVKLVEEETFKSASIN